MYINNDQCNTFIALAVQFNSMNNNDNYQVNVLNILNILNILNENAQLFKFGYI